MKIVIESQFFPPVSTFAYLAKADELILEVCENYQKRSYRNRCIILNPNGRFLISVPLIKGKNEQQNIKDVQISYSDDWVDQMIKQLQSAYGKSPFYNFYKDPIRDILTQNPPTLFELNTLMLSLTFEVLGWSPIIKMSTEYIINYPAEICDLRSKFSPLNNKKIHSDVHLVYSQVFEYKFGFTSGLSILDLIFNYGPESSSLLRNVELPSVNP